VKEDARLVTDERLDLRPADTLARTFPVTRTDARWSVEIADASGRAWIAHTEGVYDVVPRAEITTGPQRAHAFPPVERQTPGDFIERGRGEELEGRLLRAWDTYQAGRERFPASVDLARAAGRLSVGLRRYDEAVPLLEAALARVSNDAEIQYALGLARAAVGDEATARAEWEAASHFRAWRAPALLQDSRQAARTRETDSALRLIADAVAAGPEMTRAGGIEVALLRRAGRTAEARARLAHWRAKDPTSAFLRLEAVRLGADDPALWTHLGGDVQRVLEIAVDEIGIGAWDDALALLSRQYPSGAGVVSEPGALPVNRHPEIAYFRGYCRTRLGQSGHPDFQEASHLPTTYVFPQRAETMVVLRRALEDDPSDATAHALVGALALSSGRVKAAIDAWEEARRLDPRRPVLHRNLGLALLHDGQLDRAREVLAEGLAADASNVEVYLALDQVLGLLGRPPDERVAALERHPDPPEMPSSLVLKLALARVEMGRFDDAESLFAGRFFPREEFGTNPRQVWVEIRLQRALAAARAGRHDEARRIAGGLSDAVPSLAFTQDGMDAFVQSARVQYLLGDLLAHIGDDAGARVRWQAAAAGRDRYPQADAAFVFLAGRRLGLGTEEERRATLEAALASWNNRLVSGTNFPGANAAGQGYFLQALGRDADARAKLREALLLPDKMMSHYLSRAALHPGGNE
jgi:tetratricopeptide (TPR) repeat protein